MPALDENIEEILATYLYYVAAPDEWATIQRQGLVADDKGEIAALNGFDVEQCQKIARDKGLREFVVLRFNPCNCEISPEIGTEATVVNVRAKVIGPCLIERVMTFPTVGG